MHGWRSRSSACALVAGCCLTLWGVASATETTPTCASLNRKMTLCPLDCKQDELCFQANNSCPYRCVKMGLGREHVEVHFRHGAYQSAKEVALQLSSHELSSLRVAQNSDDPDAPTNDDVNAIDRLDVSSAVTAVWLVAGHHQQIKGYVINITLAPQLLTKTNVNNVVLKGINVGETKPTLTDIFPLELESLELSNTLLEEVPAELPRFTKLKQLKLDTNYIRTLPKAFAFPNLSVLVAANNELSTFDASLPTLRSLDLSFNRLTKIPPSVFEMENLETLNLAGNNITKAWLTNDQYEFLTQPRLNVTLDRGTGDTSCALHRIKNVTTATNSVVPFCVGPAPPNTEASPAAAAQSKSTSSSIPVAVGSSIAVLVVIVLALAIVWRRKGKTDRKNETLDSFDSPTNVMFAMEDVEAEGDALFLGDKKILALRVDSAELHDMQRLGAGGYGEVWLVSYRGTQLASKRLIAQSNSDHLTKFIAEIRVNASLSHSRIVKFEGAAWTNASNLQALFEYMPRGDLRTWLVDPQNDSDWTAQKMSIIMDIVEALVYVHSFSPPLVHRDLKSRNVLLSESLRAKLCDFGIARFQSVQETMTVAMGTGLWLAPEVIACRRDYDQFADI